jgi:hypothetical protein
LKVYLCLKKKFKTPQNRIFDDIEHTQELVRYQHSRKGYIWGYNTVRQFNYPHNVNNLINQIGNKSVPIEYNPPRINDPIKVYTGKGITFFLNKYNGRELYGYRWSNQNQKGKNALGLGSLGGDKINTESFLPIDSKIIKIDTNEDFSTFILTDSGHLFACGTNNKGQLGVGDNSDKNIFTECKDESNNVITHVVDVVSLKFSTFLITSNNDIYSCGGKELLGISSESDVNVFTKITDVDSKLRVIHNDSGSFPGYPNSTYNFKFVNYQNIVVNVNNARGWEHIIYSWSLLSGKDNSFQELSATELKKNTTNFAVVINRISGKGECIIFSNDTDSYICGRNLHSTVKYSTTYPYTHSIQDSNYSNYTIPIHIYYPNNDYERYSNRKLHWYVVRRGDGYKYYFYEDNDKNNFYIYDIDNATLPIMDDPRVPNLKANIIRYQVFNTYEDLIPERIFTNWNKNIYIPYRNSTSGPLTKTFFADGVEWIHNGTEVVSSSWINNDLYDKLSSLTAPSELLHLIQRGGVGICATDQVIFFLEYLT